MLVFEEGEKPEYPEKNLSEHGREPKTNSSHMEIEPGPHWWEVSALTIVPSMPPKVWHKKYCRRFCCMVL